MRSLKRAFDELYRGKETSDAIDYLTLLKIERHRRRRLIKLLALESLGFLALTFLMAYEFLKPQEYATMGFEGVQVRVVKDVSLLDLSRDLGLLGLKMEGPYQGDIFLIKGNENKVRELLKKREELKEVK